jgi:PAS domain-containing protein
MKASDSCKIQVVILRLAHAQFHPVDQEGLEPVSRCGNIFIMIQKQTYEDLEQMIQELKKEAFDRNRVEEALEESETRYRRLFETAQDGILILDAGTERIEDANPFIVDMLGFSTEEVVGKKLWEIGPFRDIEAIQLAFLELQIKEYIRYEHLPLQTKTVVLLP